MTDDRAPGSSDSEDKLPGHVISAIAAIRAYFMGMIADLRAARASSQGISETTEPASAIATASGLQVVICSNTSLSEQEFRAQTEKFRRVASYDGDSRSWYTWVSLDRTERAIEVLNTLFEAARVHGTMIQVLAQPSGRVGLSE